MSENNASARCTVKEWELARNAGILVVTTSEEAAIHKFAEAIRAESAMEISALRACARHYLKELIGEHEDLNAALEGDLLDSSITGGAA